LIAKVESKTGRRIGSIQELVKLGFFKTVPTDPKGFQYIVDARSGQVGLSPDSTIRRY
jgi:hypothetical protein